MRVHPQPKTHIINKSGIASSKEPVRHPLPARVSVGVGGLVCMCVLRLAVKLLQDTLCTP